jgi:hypothetical protein
MMPPCFQIIFTFENRARRFDEGQCGDDDVHIFSWIWVPELLMTDIIVG